MATNQVEKKTERGLGTSDTKTLAEMFPAAATTKYDPAALIKELLDGVKAYNPDLGSFSMDYKEAPKVTTFVANPVPPGPGDVNPNNQPPPPTNWPPPPGNWASLETPADTSEAISNQEFDALVPGSSS